MKPSAVEISPEEGEYSLEEVVSMGHYLQAVRLSRQEKFAKRFADIDAPTISKEFENHFDELDKEGYLDYRITIQNKKERPTIVCEMGPSPAWLFTVTHHGK